MAIERIPDLGDRQTATKVLSDLVRTTGTGDVAGVENLILSAMQMIKQSGGAVTEIRLKEIATKIMSGEIQANAPGNAQPASETPMDFRTGSSSGGNFIQNNKEDLSYGRGNTGLAPYGDERQQGQDYSADTNVGNAIMDAAGTFAWNFTNSLLIGLPGFAYNKALKPMTGENGFTDFVDGMRSVDTEAGKWGEGLGVAASFLGPGGFIKGAGKAATIINKGNLVGKVFGSGGSLMRRVTGVAGVIEKGASEGATVAGKAVDLADNIKKLEINLSAVQKERDTLKASASAIMKGRMAGKVGLTGDTLSKAGKALKDNRLREELITKTIDDMRKVGGKDKEVAQIIQTGLRKAGRQFYDTRRKLTSKAINEITADGLKEGIKTRLAANIYGDVLTAVGDEKIAREVVGRAINGMDDAIAGMVNGTKTWGEVFHAGSPLLKGFSERVGKIIQNGTEEAIGFATHSLLFETIKGLSETEDYDLDTLKDIVTDKALPSARNSLVTAAVFATGGGIPFKGMGALPMKLFLPTRKTDLAEVFKAGMGLNAHSAQVFSNSIHRFIGSGKNINKVMNEYRQGIGGGSGKDVLKRLRERGLIDYERLGADYPEALETIASRLLLMERNGAASALARVGGVTPKSELETLTNELRNALARNGGKNTTPEVTELIKKMSGFLKEQAERSIDMNWQGVVRGLKHDSWRNALTTASIFIGGGGKEMIEGMKNDEVHASDVFTHFLFSASSAMHGLHMLPGKAIGEPAFDSKITATDEVMADNQNKMILNSLGINVGTPAFFKNVNNMSDKSIFAGGENDPKIKQLFDTFSGATKEEVNMMNVVMDTDQAVDHTTTATTSEIRTALQHLRSTRTMFPEDHPLAILNDMINRDVFVPEDKLLGLNENSDAIGKGLAYVVKQMKTEMNRSGIIDDAFMYTSRFDDSMIMSYANEFYTNRIKVLRDIGDISFQEIKRVLGLTSSAVGPIRFGDMKDVAVEGIDNAEAVMMLDRLMNVIYTTGSATRDFKNPIVLGDKTKAEEVLKILLATNKRVRENFNDIGIDNPRLTRGLVKMVEAGYATAGKAVFVDGAKAQVVHKETQLGSAGKTEIHNAAIAAGFLNQRGNVVEIVNIDTKALEEAGMNVLQISEVRNFIDVLRASYGFNTATGRTITREEAEKFFKANKVTIGDAEHDLSLSELTKGMNIDFSNNIGSREMEYHVLRAASSKISPEKYATYNMLRRIGIIYDDPVHGKVALRLVDDEGFMEPVEGRPDLTIVDMIKRLGYDQGRRGSLAGEQITAGGAGKGQPKDYSPIDSLNKELSVIIEELRKIGLVSGYAPEGAFARFGGIGDPKEMVDKLQKIAEGRNFLREENARESVAELMRFFNEMDIKKEFEGIDYKKVKMLSSKIIYFLGKEKTNAYDWMQVKAIMDKYGAFTKEMNEAKLRDAIEEVGTYLRDSDFVDSSIKRFEDGEYDTRLDGYDAIIGNEAHHAYTLSKLFGETGFNFTPEFQKQYTRELRSAALRGKDSFNETLELIADKSGKKYSLDKMSPADIAGIYTSLRGTRTIKRITLGDFRKQQISESDDPIETIASGAKIEDMNVNAGYLTSLAESLGLDVALLSGTINLADTNYSIFKQHNEDIQRQIDNRIEEIRRGGYQYLEPGDGDKILWKKSHKNDRSAVLTFGDMSSYVVISLPNNDIGAKSLAERLKKITDIYTGSYDGAFKSALENLNTMRTYLESGDYKNAFRNQTAYEEAFRFMMLHEMLGKAGMERIPKEIEADTVAKTLSRFRQANSRQYTPAARDAIESFIEKGSIPGYSDGKAKGIIIDDENLPGMLASSVSRGDGQIWFHSKLLKAQGRSHGNNDDVVGVIKNMIMDNEIGPNGENLGTLLTKNAGAVNPEMDALMDKLGVSFIATKNSVKLFGSRGIGKIFDAEGKELRINEILNGGIATRHEGSFDINIESLRYNKSPHESEATIGYQIENMIRDDIVRDISEAYYSAKFEGGAGILDLSRELYADTPEARAKLRKFVIKQLNRSKFSDSVDLSEEFGGNSLSDQYLRAGQYGSPADFWFKARSLSILKKSVMQNAIFKTKERSGRQDILAADMKGLLNTNEAVAAHNARYIELHDSFDVNNESPYGFNFAIKLEGDGAFKVAADDIKSFFGFKGDNHYNEMKYGDGSEIEKELGKSSYIYRRLFKVDVEKGTVDKNGRASFIVDAIFSGAKAGKSSGIFKYLKGMNDNQIRTVARELNNYVIDAIQGRADVSNIERLARVLPKEAIESLAVEAGLSKRMMDITGSNPNPGYHAIGDVYDIVGTVLGGYKYHARRLGSEQGKQSVTWGIGGVNQRYPSARPNDTIPMVFLGFLDKSMGNQVMLNYYDSVLKGEADYDIDNFNYWFRTPKSHFAEINRVRNSVGVNKTDPPAKKIDSAQTQSLNPFSERDAKAYGVSQERASYLRGITVNSNSSVEKMVKDKYKISFTHNGEKFVIRSKYKDLESAMSSDEGIKSFMVGSKMLQEILDSKKGMLASKYMNNEFDPFIEIMKEFFVVENVDGKKPVTTEWRAEYEDMMRAAVSPYKRMLAFSKRTWVGDTSESMNWQDMKNIALGWDKIMSDNPERNIEFVIKDYLGIKKDDGPISNIRFEFKHSNSMAEDAARKIIKIDNVVNSGESSEVYGREMADITELARYIADSKWDGLPSDSQVAEFISKINTKNWNIRQTLDKRMDLSRQIKDQSTKAAKGDKFAMRRVEMLREQLKSLSFIESAIRKGKIKDPEIMHKFSSKEEESNAWENTKSVEAITLMLNNMNVDQQILDAMMADARELRKQRGILWAKELNSTMEGHNKVYDEQRQVEISNMVKKYLKKWYFNSEAFGDAAYDPNAAILALVKPDVEYAYTGTGSRRFVGYKKVAADIFGTAVDLSLGKRPSKLKSFLDDLGYHYAVTSQYMEGRSGELSAIMRLREMSEEHSKLLSIAVRFNRRNEETITTTSVLRNMGYTEEQIQDADVFKKVFGIDVSDVVKLDKKTPAEYADELLSVTIRRKIPTTDLVDVTGMDVNLSPLMRIDIRDDRYLSDSDGIWDREAARIMDQKLRDKKEDPLDRRNADTWIRVKREVDKMHSGMIKFITNRGGDPNDISSSGKAENYIDNIILKSSDSQSIAESEGLCK